VKRRPALSHSTRNSLVNQEPSTRHWAAAFRAWRSFAIARWLLIAVLLAGMVERSLAQSDDREQKFDFNGDGLPEFHFAILDTRTNTSPTWVFGVVLVQRTTTQLLSYRQYSVATPWNDWNRVEQYLNPAVFPLNAALVTNASRGLAWRMSEELWMYYCSGTTHTENGQTVYVTNRMAGPLSTNSGYLGVRFSTPDGHRLGWLKLAQGYASPPEFSWQPDPNQSIVAGQIVPPPVPDPPLEVLPFQIMDFQIDFVVRRRLATNSAGERFYREITVQPRGYQQLLVSDPDSSQGLVATNLPFWQMIPWEAAAGTRWSRVNDEAILVRNDSEGRPEIGLRPGETNFYVGLRQTAPEWPRRLFWIQLSPDGDFVAQTEAHIAPTALATGVSTWNPAFDVDEDGRADFVLESASQWSQVSLPQNRWDMYGWSLTAYRSVGDVVFWQAPSTGFSWQDGPQCTRPQLALITELSTPVPATPPLSPTGPGEWATTGPSVSVSWNCNPGTGGAVPAGYIPLWKRTSDGWMAGWIHHNSGQFYLEKTPGVPVYAGETRPRLRSSRTNGVTTLRWTPAPNYRMQAWSGESPAQGWVDVPSNSSTGSMTVTEDSVCRLFRLIRN
jgi:hypothetical protein